MKSRIATNNKDASVEIIISSRRLIGLSVFLAFIVVGFSIAFLTLGLDMLGQNPSVRDVVIFIGLAIFFLAFIGFLTLIVMWNICGKEILRIFPTQLYIEKWFGRIRLRSTGYDSSKIKNMQFAVRKVKVRGGMLSHPSLMFNYEDQDIWLTCHLPELDVESLLRGPLHGFIGK